MSTSISFRLPNQERRTSAVFGELAYHLDEGAGIPAVHKLTVNVSARHDWIQIRGRNDQSALAVILATHQPSFYAARIVRYVVHRAAD